MAEAVQAQLAAIGIQVEVKNLPTTAAAQALANGEDDLAIYGFSATTFEVGRNLVRWLPDSTDLTIFGYNDPAYTTLVTNAMKTVDKDARYKLFNQAQEMLMQSQIALPMWSNELNAAMQPNVQGFYIMRSYFHHLLQTVSFK